ncbi:MAG: ferrous iron transport protein A [Anaerolineaceae bacterium]|nr:ferrous iron transport protein A [Anaerolineaceae bacterium]
MRLLDVEKEKDVIVVAIEAGRSVESKLRQLGVMPGNCVRVLRQAPFRGPLLVLAGGREVALGQRIAAKIMVEEKPCESP